MFVILTQLQKGEPTLLQTVIDNTGGKLNVALRGFHYEVGYRNIRSSQGFFTRIPHPQNPKTFISQAYPVPTGLYDFERLSLFIKENINGVRIVLTAVAIINLYIPPPIEIKFQSDLRQILGIAEKRLDFRSIIMRETDRQKLLSTSGYIFISTNSQQPLILSMVTPQPCLR